MNWIKKNFKIIIMVVLAFMWVNSCSHSCSYKRSLKTQDDKVTELQAMVDSQEVAISNYKIDIEWLEKNKQDISNVANGNQTSYIEQISQLNKDIAKLTKERNSLANENTGLKSQVKTLETQLRELRLKESN